MKNVKCERSTEKKKSAEKRCMKDGRPKFMRALCGVKLVKGIL